MTISQLKEQVKTILREKTMNEAGITRTYRAFMSLKHKVKELEEKQLEMLKQWQSEKNLTKKNSLLDMMKKSTKELQKQRSYLAKLEDNYINKMSYDDSYSESVNEAVSEPEVISQLRDIVKNKQNALVVDTKSKKKVRVDMQSANLMLQVYDTLKQQSNKDKFVKGGIVQMGHVSYKLLNR